MRIATTLCGAALAVIASWSAAQATTLSGNGASDDGFTVYLSTNDSVLGTAIGSGGTWFNTYSVSGALTAGVTNYLHIVAHNDAGPNMFIGSFSLSDSLFQFANGTQSLVTNTTDWKAGIGGVPWFAPSGTPLDLGVDGTGPWGNRPGVDDAAHFLWRNPNTQAGGDEVFLSTRITSVAATPIPAALPFFLTALGGLGLLARKKRQASAV